MERRPHGANRDSMSRRIYEGTTEKLGTGNKHNRRSIEELSYTSPPVRKQHPYGETTPKSYKPAFHSGHLSRNTSYGSAATLQVFRLP